MRRTRFGEMEFQDGSGLYGIRPFGAAIDLPLLTLIGTSGDDVLTGAAGNDLLRGLAGDDTLNGGDGLDRLYGDTGEDLLRGGDGDDRLFGGDQSDRLLGDGGDDLVSAGQGHDIAHGGGGNDRLLGGSGRDNLYGDDGHDTLLGEDGADRIFGGGGNDDLDGGAGGDLLSGNDGHDTLHGGIGNDRLLGGAGRDNLYGDEGNDRLAGDDGADRLFGGAGNDDIYGGDGGDLLSGNDGHDTIHGGAGDDRILGGAGRDTLFGDADNDVMLGGDGADRLDGGEGRDELTGGLGNDTINGGADVDTAVFSGNFADSSLALAGAAVIVTGPDGIDTLNNIERLQFDDELVILVLDQDNAEIPVITSGAAVSVAENQTAAYTVTATDADSHTLMRYFLGGTDGDLFDINARTGAVAFRTAPDFEAPGDADGDNVYDIVVRVFDGANTVDQAVAITVTDLPLEFIDLTTLSASQGFVIRGDGADDRAGDSVSSAGDVNGDGYDDFIVGVPHGGDGGSWAGEAYVLFGTASGFGTNVNGRQVVDLSTLSAADGFIIQGDVLGDTAGGSVSSAGDVNGDGLDDVVVGAFGGNDGAHDGGEAYVVFGSSSGFGVDVGGRQVIDLTGLTAGQGFIIQGDTMHGWVGISVSLAGDIDGDGYDDLIIGAERGDTGGENSGEVFVVFGSGSGFGVNVGGRQVIDVNSLSASEGFVIQGDTAGDFAGGSVSSAGDINYDGYDDLFIGARGGDDGGDGAGEAYVVFGAASGFGADIGGRQVIDLTSLNASEGFIIQGDAPGDYAGRSVASAGDVNGDGFDDLIVGAPYARADDGRVGAAYIVFGKAAGFGTAIGGRQVLDLTSLNASEGFIIHGETGYDQHGRTVSSAGDVNGDGYDDLIVGSALSDGGGEAAGNSYVIFGTGSGFGIDVAGRQVIEISNLGASEGFTIQGDAALDRAGESVSSAGDVNGDGYDDLIIGARWAGTGRADSHGEAYVIFGAATGSLAGLVAVGTVGANTMIGSAGDDSLTGNGGADVIRSGAGDDVIGISDAGFFRIDAGHGDDTLRLDGSGIDLDFTALAQNAVTDLERIDLTGSGDNILRLTALDVFDMMEAREDGVAVLRVTGNAGDSIDFSDAGWVAAGQVVEDGVTYNRFTNGNAEVRLQQEAGAVLQTPIDPGKSGEVPVMAVLDTAEALPGLDVLNTDGVGFMPRGLWALDGDTAWGDRHHVLDASGPPVRGHFSSAAGDHDLPLPATARLAALTALSDPGPTGEPPVVVSTTAPAASEVPVFDSLPWLDEARPELPDFEALDGWH